ncbi:MAG: hypothetical protein JWO56_3611 [Acidobacteria bacterium]|nr:hypothetical protein [Acidobacteriota bacterium]
MSSAAVLQGSLDSFKLPEVLTFLNTTRRRGTLTAIGNDGREAYVFFDNGALIYAGSNQEQFRLSAILLRKKRITREQHEQIDALMQREGGRFGQIAIQSGILTEPLLRDFLKIQVSEILYDSFVWTGGTFSFSNELELPSYAVTISVDLSNLIMEGARRIEEWEQCIQLLPDKTVVFRVVSHPTEEKITLTADEWKILFLINGVRTLDELCHDSEEDPFHVYRVVYGLASNGLIEVAAAADRHEDHTDSMTAMTGDATVRQAPAVFSAESTVREMPDDTNLLVSSEARLTYKDVVKTTVAQLVITNGDGNGTVIPLSDPEYLVGRQKDNSIQLTDLGVSGFHARIYRGPDGYAIEDLKSRNGTWLNATRVFHAILKNADRLRLGATEMRFEVLYDGGATS